MRATAERMPDRIAITFNDRSITFGALEHESNRVANALAALGLAAGDRLLRYLPNCPEHEIAFYGASKVGAIVCPMNPAYREREIACQANDSGASVLITHETLWPIVEATSRAPLGQDPAARPALICLPGGRASHMMGGMPTPAGTKVCDPLAGNRSPSR